MYNDNNKFDIDLAYGQVKEKELAKILFEKKIEVKSDKIWKKTGNIAVENITIKRRILCLENKKNTKTQSS